MTHDEQRDNACPECGGRTVDFRGRGLNLEAKVCSRWTEPGHLSETEWREKLRQAIHAALPSGRWA